MKAILIDVRAQTVTNIELMPGLQPMYDAIQCSCICRVSLDDETDLWLDDAGLLHKPQPPKFKISGYDNTFAGNGLICGYNDEGETISTIYTAEQVRPLIEFLGEVHVTPPPTIILSWDL